MNAARLKERLQFSHLNSIFYYNIFQDLSMRTQLTESAVKVQQVTQAVLFERESAHLEESIQEMHDILDPILSFSCLLTHSCFFYIYLFRFLVTKLRL